MKNLEKDLKSPSTEEIPSDTTYHAWASDHRSASNNRNAQLLHLPSNLSLLVGVEHHMRPVPLLLVPYVAVLIEEDIGKNWGHLCHCQHWHCFLPLPSLWPGPRVGSSQFCCQDCPPSTMPMSSGIGGVLAMMNTKIPHQDHRHLLQCPQPDC
jgi:hypothetical protein